MRRWLHELTKVLGYCIIIMAITESALVYTVAKNYWDLSKLCYLALIGELVISAVLIFISIFILFLRYSKKRRFK